MFVLKVVEKVGKWEPGVTGSFLGLLNNDTWMERGKFKYVESIGIPPFHGILVGVDPQILPFELELGHSIKQFQKIRI